MSAVAGPARQGLSELFAGTRDYLAGQTPEQKVAALAKTSYRAFLTDVCKLPADAANFFQGRSSDNFGYGIDAIGALDAMGEGYPGARALRIEDKAGGHAEDKAAYIHHFPDGNASLARALVRSLVEGVGARPQHGRPRHHRLRLCEPGPTGCARAHPPAVDRRQGAQHGRRHAASTSATSRTASCAACGRAARWWPPTRTVMPYLCPELERDPVELMLSNVKAPLVYTKVVVRNWQSFVRLGTHKISAPTSFHTTVKLDYPVSLGGYKFPRRPTEPMALHLVHVPLEPGTGPRHAHAGAHRPQPAAGHELRRLRAGDPPGPRSHAAARAGSMRAATSSPSPSIAGRTATPTRPTASTMMSRTMQARIAAARAKLGNIVFANSDTAWDAYAHSAMEEAVRAVGELLGAAPAEVRQPWYTRFLRRFSKT